MAKKSRIPGSGGTIDNLTSSETKDADAAPQMKKIKVDTTDRTKENMQDFARAASGAQLIRQTFADILSDTKDASFNLRLNLEMARVVKADTLNPRGSRNIVDGNIQVLQGLEVNTETHLAAVLKAPFEAFIDRASGLAIIDFPSLITTSLLRKPRGASHFRFTVAAASIDFVTEEHAAAQIKGTYLPISNEGVASPSLEVQLSPAGKATVILALGISFYQKVNKQFYLIGNGHNNAVSFVAVSGS